MWLDATASAWRIAVRIPRVALLTASTAAPARTVSLRPSLTLRRADSFDARSLVEANARLDHLRAETEREPRRLHVRRRSQEQAAEEERGRTARRDLVARERLRLLGRADLRARLDDLVPVADLCLARRDLERAAGPVRSASTPCRLAARPDPVHRALGGAAHLDRAASPTRSRRIGRSSHSVETKPPFRPLGPCPASPASSTTTSSPGSSAFSCHAVQSPR